MLMTLRSGGLHVLSRASGQCFALVNLGIATNNVAELKAIELLCDEVRQKLVGDCSLVYHFLCLVFLVRFLFK